MKSKFLLAEEVRPEQSGKLTVLGLYADDVIALNSERPADIAPDARPAIPKLCCVVTVSEIPQGEYEFSASLLSANGEDIIPKNSSMGKIAIEEGRSHTGVIQVAPFVVVDYGTYTLILHVNELEARFQFEIRLGSQS